MKPTKSKMLQLRITKELLEAVEAFAENIDEKSRSKAVIELIERGLRK